MRPAKANATTNGGLIKKFARTCWCTRASKLRLPESTETPTTLCFSIAASNSAGNGPELPMQVVQP